MYQSFEVSNYRCFSELTLPELERVNLIAGMNNVGKSTLLEAIFLHCGAYNPELAIRVNAFRGIEKVRIGLEEWIGTPWDSLFHQFDTTKTIKLSGKDITHGKRFLWLKLLREPPKAQILQGPQEQIVYEESQKVLVASEALLVTSKTAKVLQLEYRENGQHGNYYMILDQKGVRIEPAPPPPAFPAFFQGARMRIPFGEEAERFGNLEIQGKQDVLLRALQLIEPRLRRLTTIVWAGEPILHGDVGSGRLMPLPLMGEGMVRLASLILQIANAPNGVVLVDEIENGLHHSVLPKVWQAIGEAAREFNTQVFATTHSLECIVAAHRAFSESERYDFRLHRLDRVGETIRAVTYDQETLEAAIETGLEVR